MNRKQRREQRAKGRRADRKRLREEYRANQTDTFWVSRSVVVKWDCCNDAMPSVGGRDVQKKKTP